MPLRLPFAAATLLSALALVSCGSREAPTFDQNTLFQGINFVGVSVSNLSASSDLYSNVVAMQSVELPSLTEESALRSLASNPSWEVATQLLKGANAQLLLMEFAGHDHASGKAVPVQGPGIAHVCYQVNKTTKTYQRFLEAGATPIGDVNLVQLNERNPVEYGYARDKDGIVFEVEHVDVAALALPEPPPHDYRIRHVSLATPDMERMVSFYSKLLDQPSPRRAGRWISLSGQKLDQVSGLPDSKIQMAWFQTRNLELELIQYKSHPTTLPDSPRAIETLGYNMIVFEVLDLAKASDLLVEAGGTLAVQSTPFPGGNLVFGRDPDGNLIGLQASDSLHPFSSRNFAGNGT